MKTTTTTEGTAQQDQLDGLQVDTGAETMKSVKRIRLESVTSPTCGMFARMPRLAGKTSWVIRDVDTKEMLSASSSEHDERARIEYLVSEDFQDVKYVLWS